MKYFITLLLSLSFTALIAQSCLPDGIEFKTQEEIDNFHTNYPGCVEIEGDVKIFSPTMLTNLHGLSGVKTINGYLYLYNTRVTDLQGLDSLESVGGFLAINNNVDLTSYSGLEKLSSIGGNLKISYNYFPQNLDALANLKTIEGDLDISNNFHLKNLDGLSSLTSINRELRLEANDSLNDINGISNIDGSTIQALVININPALSVCHVKSICDYLTNPGPTLIIANKTGCNSQDEVVNACASSISDNNIYHDLKVGPNPFTTSTTIEYTLHSSQTVTITFYNQFGKQVDRIVNKQPEGTQKVIWAPELPGGIYYFRLEAGDQQASGKVVLVR